MLEAGSLLEAWVSEGTLSVCLSGITHPLFVEEALLDEVVGGHGKRQPGDIMAVHQRGLLQLARQCLQTDRQTDR